MNCCLGIFSLERIIYMRSDFDFNIVLTENRSSYNWTIALSWCTLICCGDVVIANKNTYFRLGLPTSLVGPECYRYHSSTVRQTDVPISSSSVWRPCTVLFSLTSLCRPIQCVWWPWLAHVRAASISSTPVHSGCQVLASGLCELLGWSIGWLVEAEYTLLICFISQVTTMWKA